MKVLFSSDLHGNIEQYKELFKIADKEKLPIILGGDLTPKDFSTRTVDGQKSFLEKDFQSLLLKYPHVQVFAMMGNDDFKDNMPLLNELSNKHKQLVILNGEPFAFQGYFLIGYPYVPLTPFKYHDWLKVDIPEDERPFVKNGVISQKGKLIDHVLVLNRNDTIEKDFACIGKACAGEKAIWVVHTPPMNTALDFNRDHLHIGSIALRRAIETYQPKITLHGHIHETVDLTGKFIEKIGKTTALAAGNSPNGSLHYLIVDLEHPEKSKRNKK
jgi:uncharacterized protein